MPAKVPLLLPSDEELRRAHPAIWMWYDHDLPNARHPVASRLALAYVRRLSHLYAPPGWQSPPYAEKAQPLPELLASTAQPYWLAHPDEFRRLYRELRELLGWLGAIPFLFEDEVLHRHTRQALGDQGLLVEEIDKLLADAARLRRGRPPTKRAIAVVALESKAHHPKRKLMDLVNEHCDCGKPPEDHNEYCADSMRVAIRELRRALRKYGV